MAARIDGGAPRHIELAVARTQQALQALEAGGALGPETGFGTAQREAANHAYLAWSSAGAARTAVDEGRNLLRDARAAADRGAPAQVADALEGAIEALTAARPVVSTQHVVDSSFGAGSGAPDRDGTRTPDDLPGRSAPAQHGDPGEGVDDLLGWRPGGQPSSDEAADPAPRWNPSSDTFGDDGGPLL